MAQVDGVAARAQGDAAGTSGGDFALEGQRGQGFRGVGLGLDKPVGNKPITPFYSITLTFSNSPAAL